MKRREGAPFTEAQLKLIRFAAVEAEYQYLIDDLMCAEEPTRKRYFNEDELTSCAIKKSSKSREMLAFFF
jgi:hypothetical protein